MTDPEIVAFLHAHYRDYRRALVPLLLRRLDEKGHSRRVYDALVSATSRPMRAVESGSDKRDTALRAGEADLADLGDQCDFYDIVLNPGIAEVTDWDFREQLQGGAEVHVLRLWVNWFLPVYYQQEAYYRGWNGFVAEMHGPLAVLEGEEAVAVGQVADAMARLGFRRLGQAFVQRRDTSLITDLSIGNASYFECLFSDLRYPCEEGREAASKWRGGWD